MKIGKEQLGMFAIAAVLFVGIAFLAWTQRPGSDDNDASAGAASDDISDLRLGMIDLHSPNPGQLAPDFVLEDAQGNRVRLSDFRGTPVFLNFWATWCPFCIEEMPDMQIIQDQFGDQLVVLGVNNGESANVGQPYATDRVGVNYRLVYDPDERVVNGYNVRAMPTSYFIDANGIIREFQFGFLTLEQMQEKVQAAMVVAQAAP